MSQINIKKFQSEVQKSLELKRAKRMERGKIGLPDTEAVIPEGVKANAIQHEGRTLENIAQQILDRRRAIIPYEHPRLNQMYRLALIRKNIWAVGPAGSGKTLGAWMLAQKMELPFHSHPIGRETMSHDIFGFHNAGGEAVRTIFREAWEHGGICLLDELDYASPAAASALNTATSSNFASFPDGVIQKHPDFVMIATANTYGTGATAQYIGSNQLNAATLDRFVFIEWGYDLRVERAISFNMDLAIHIEKLRAKCEAMQIKHVISPRATIDGSDMLEIGFTLQEVESMVIFKGLDSHTVNKIKTFALPS